MTYYRLRSLHRTHRTRTRRFTTTFRFANPTPTRRTCTTATTCSSFYVNTNDFQPLLVLDYIMAQKKLAAARPWQARGRRQHRQPAALSRSATMLQPAAPCLISDRHDLCAQPIDEIYPSVAGTRTQGMYQYRRRRQGARVLQPHRCSNRRLRAQVKTVIEQYELDGVNLWDRNSGYGKGHASHEYDLYPKLIKALREALGTEKLLTVTVYEEADRYFLGHRGVGRNRRRGLHRLRMVGLQ